jgi:magnesium transporter
MANKKNSRQDNQVYLFDYDEKKLEEKPITDINHCIPYKETPTVTWINVDSVPPISFIHELRLGFDLHPVVEEDILNINQRPKIETLENYIFLALKMFNFDKDKSKVVSEQVSIILAKNFLLTFQQGIKGDNFESVRKMLRDNNQRLRSSGTDFLCYELIASIVFNYFNVLDDFSNYIEILEKEMIEKPGPETLNKIYHLKRQILELKKSVWPLREVIHILERSESEFISKESRIYLRDIYENLIQVVDVIETYRDIMSGMLDVYLSSISNRTNSVMKILAVITTIFMPISFFAGFYGMNFKYLPGLESPAAPFFITIAMALSLAVMLLIFKLKKWF